MSLFDRKPPFSQRFGQGMERPLPQKNIKTNITPEVKKGPFDMKKSYKRWKIREKLKNPELYNKVRLSKKERINIEKDVLTRKKYGDLITGNEIKKEMKNLNKKLFETRDGEGKKKIKRQIDTLKAILK